MQILEEKIRPAAMYILGVISLVLWLAIIFASVMVIGALTS